jgi:hypothetical protein
MTMAPIQTTRRWEKKKQDPKVYLYFHSLHLKIKICSDINQNMSLEILFKKKNARSQAPVAHTCNPSYSGGKDQKDRGSKSAQANSL